MNLDNDWDKWRHHVLKELESQSKKIDNMIDHITNIKTEIAILKVKASIWGMIGGSVPIIVAILIVVTKKFIS